MHVLIVGAPLEYHEYLNIQVKNVHNHKTCFCDGNEQHHNKNPRVAGIVSLSASLSELTVCFGLFCWVPGCHAPEAVLVDMHFSPPRVLQVLPVQPAVLTAHSFQV